MDDVEKNPDVPNSKGSNGERDTSGRFKPGWRGGPGNPQLRHAADMRKRLDTALRSVCTAAKLRKIIESLVDAAIAGDVGASRLLFDRLAGPAVAIDIITKLEALEAQLESEDENASSDSIY